MQQPIVLGGVEVRRLGIWRDVGVLCDDGQRGHQAPSLQVGPQVQGDHSTVHDCSCVTNHPWVLLLGQRYWEWC